MRVFLAMRHESITDGPSVTTETDVLGAFDSLADALKALPEREGWGLLVQYEVLEVTLGDGGLQTVHHVRGA